MNEELPPSQELSPEEIARNILRKTAKDAGFESVEEMSGFDNDTPEMGLNAFSFAIIEASNQTGLTPEEVFDALVPPVEEKESGPDKV